MSEVILLLGTHGTRGLDPSEAAARLHRFGPNALPPVQGPGALRRWLSQFNHPLIYVLLGAAVVTAALGETVDSAVILGVVLINAAVGYIQESRADTAHPGAGRTHPDQRPGDPHGHHAAPGRGGPRYPSLSPLRTVAILASVGLLAAGCGSDEEAASGGGTALEGVSVTVGSKDFTENILLGQMLAQAMAQELTHDCDTALTRGPRAESTGPNTAQVP